MKPIFFHPEAEDEFDKAIAYYEEKLEGLGLEFKAEVEDALDGIAKLPGLRAFYKGTKYRKWVLKRFPFSIFYLERDEDIWISAVAHQKRKPDYWKGRLEEFDD